MNLPPSWSRMSWYQRCAYLCSSNQARDFSHAASMMASLPRPRRIKPAAVYTPATRNVRPPYSDQ
jgi:hypothetical protein